MYVYIRIGTVRLLGKTGKVKLEQLLQFKRISMNTLPREARICMIAFGCGLYGDEGMYISIYLFSLSLSLSLSLWSLNKCFVILYNNNNSNNPNNNPNNNPLACSDFNTDSPRNSILSRFGSTKTKKKHKSHTKHRSSSHNSTILSSIKEDIKKGQGGGGKGGGSDNSSEHKPANNQRVSTASVIPVGWVALPIFSADGLLLNETTELRLRPFDLQINIDDLISRDLPAGVVMSFTDWEPTADNVVISSVLSRTESMSASRSGLSLSLSERVITGLLRDSRVITGLLRDSRVFTGLLRDSRVITGLVRLEPVLIM